MAGRKNGTRSGYTEYRYGTPPKKLVTLPQIFKGRRRETLVSELMDMLDDWRLSAFQGEGAAVSGLRSGLCLLGYDFPRSEQEAFEIVGTALRRNGAKRPTFAEGQPEYTTARENCRTCRIELPNQNLTGLRNRPFCSKECARVFLDRGRGVRRINDDFLMRSAYRMVSSLAVPPRQCKQCAELFHPKFEASDAAFCSRGCSRTFHRTAPDFQCQHCHQTFRSRYGDVAGKNKYCSIECKKAGGFTTRYEKTCEVCGTAYLAKLPYSKYCGSKCNAVVQRRKRLAAAKTAKIYVLTPQVFDGWFKSAA